jgi:hypothetical protein
MGGMHMASFFFRIKTSTETKASAHMRADYINREGKYSQGTKAEELLFKESKNMPEWAKENPRKFWEASEDYEKDAGRTSYREIVFALPNELSLEQQKAYTKEFLENHFGNDFVYSYAIHEKAATLAYGVQNPHVHVVFCERKLDGIERDEAIFFKRADFKVPERGGAPKDARWNGNDRKGYLRFMREDCANLQNKYLEREGFSERVDHRTKELMYWDAIRNGDIDKAETLEIPKEQHLGPKVSSRISRDLKMLTAGVENPAERSKIRAQYLKSLEEANLSKVVMLFETRMLKKDLHKRNERDHSRKEQQVKYVDTMSNNLFWRAKRMEARAMKSKLAIERFRLERAEKGPNPGPKISYWRGHFESRLKVYEALQNRIDNHILSQEDHEEINKIKSAIIAKANAMEKEQAISQKVILKELYPELSQKDMKNLAKQHIDEINLRLAGLKKEEKALTRKLRTETQIEAIVEWKVSNGLLSSIYRDQKRMEVQRREFKSAMREFEQRPLPERSAQWKYDLELAHLHDWEDAIQDLSASISSRRAGWKIQKNKLENQKEIQALFARFAQRNVSIEARVKRVKEQKFKLYQERSEWRKLNYAINRPGESGKFLRLAREAFGQLQQAVYKLREARGRGRMGDSVKLRFSDDDENKQKKYSQEYE